MSNGVSAFQNVKSIFALNVSLWTPVFSFLIAAAATNRVNIPIFDFLFLFQNAVEALVEYIG